MVGHFEKNGINEEPAFDSLQGKPRLVKGFSKYFCFSGRNFSFAFRNQNFDRRYFYF